MGAFYDWSKEQESTERVPASTVREPSLHPERRPSCSEPVETSFRTPRQTVAVPSRNRAARRRRQQLRRRRRGVAITLLCVLLLFLWRPWNAKSTASTPVEEGRAELERGQAEPEQMDNPDEPEDESGVPLVAAPDWVTVNLLPINEYSRPGTLLSQVNGVVVHYVGNPGTTAAQNSSYFASLAETHKTYASSHFVIDTDGAVIQCVPLNEVAYCSNDRNDDTISIECCHLGDTGEFTTETLASLKQLLNWLMDTYNLGREDILRHYDVIGKECPKYFVQHPEEWENFLDSLSASAPLN